MKKDFIKKPKGNREITRMVIDGIIVGLISGFFSVLYRYIITKTNTIRDYIFSFTDIPHIALWVVLFFAMALIIGQLLKWAPLSGGSGIPQIRAEVLERTDMNETRTLIAKFIGGSFGNIAGLSLGREGPSIQIGGAVAKKLAKILKRDEIETKFMITAGSSAGLAAAFNAPLAGALFSLEEIHKSFSRYVMVPCIISSVIANYISFLLLGERSAFAFTAKDPLPIKYIYLAIILGILSGLIGVLFNVGLIGAQRAYKKTGLSQTKRLLLVMAIALFVGYFLYFATGGGHSLAEDIAGNLFPLKALILILVVKLIYTWISYGSGAQGGIFLPVLVIGGVTGAIFCKLIDPVVDVDAYYVNFIILGMAGILTAVVRAPIMSMLLVIEMTGTLTHLISLTVVAIVAYYVAEALNNPPVYESLFDGIMESLHIKQVSDDESFGIYDYMITKLTPCVDMTLEDAKFPHHLIVAAIERDGVELVPGSQDRLLAGDKVTIIAKAKYHFDIDEYFKSENSVIINDDPKESRQ